MVVVVVGVEGGGRGWKEVYTFHRLFHLLLEFFPYTQPRRYPNYMYNIIFPDFLFLTIRSGGVGRRCLRRCIRRRRRRGRSLLVVHPTRQLLRAAPSGKSPVVCQNEAMEVRHPVNPPASPCPLKQAQLTTRRRPKSPPTRHRRHGNAGPAPLDFPSP